MAANSGVNDQITDAVTQVNVSVLAEAPAQAMGNLYQVFSQSVGASMQNAVANQQSMNLIDTAVVSQGINMLFTMDAVAETKATQEILGGNDLAEIIAALQAVVSALNEDEE